MTVMQADDRADDRADRASEKDMPRNSVLERTERTTFYHNISKIISYWKYRCIRNHVRRHIVSLGFVRSHLTLPHELYGNSSALSAPAPSGVLQ